MTSSDCIHLHYCKLYFIMKTGPGITRRACGHYIHCLGIVIILELYEPGKWVLPPSDQTPSFSSNRMDSLNSQYWQLKYCNTSLNPQNLRNIIKKVAKIFVLHIDSFFYSFTPPKNFFTLALKISLLHKKFFTHSGFFYPPKFFLPPTNFSPLCYNILLLLQKLTQYIVNMTTIKFL